MKELEDYNWFPTTLRNFQTEFIGFVVSKFNVYGGFVEHLKKNSLLSQTMTDLCSGSGEPATSIFKKSNCFKELVLTDLYPNFLNTSDERISYETKSMDVLAMEFNRDGCYTMFNAFHHFSNESKLEIIQKIQESGSNAFFAEILEPRLVCLLKVILATSLGTIIFTPFIQPFSFKRLLFTYIIPVNILTITFDGIVSVLKSRSHKQYQKLFEGFDNVKVLRLTKGFTPIVLIQIQR